MSFKKRFSVGFFVSLAIVSTGCSKFSVSSKEFSLTSPAPATNAVGDPSPNTASSPLSVLGVDEPVLNPATQALLFRDDFESCSSFSDAIAGGWMGVNGGSLQDYTTDSVNGSNLIIPGRAGKGLRLKYDGLSNGAGQEAHAWGRKASLDGIAGKPGHALYVSYSFRIQPGVGESLDVYSPTLGFRPIVQVKWIELWSSYFGSRAQFSSGYSVRSNYAPPLPDPQYGGGTLWGFYANPAGNTTSQAGQMRGPWAHEGAGQWHRITYKYASASSAHSGTAQVATINTIQLDAGASAVDGSYVDQWIWIASTAQFNRIASYVGSTRTATMLGNWNGGAPTGTPTFKISNLDGIGQMWYDGTKIVSVAAADCNSVVPNNVGIDGHTGLPPVWCVKEDLGAFSVDDPISHITLGSVMTNRLWPFAIDYDDFQVWRD